MTLQIVWIGLALIWFALRLPAQAPELSSSARTKAQEAYRSWREADPNLEADAANNPATLGVRSDRVAAEAARYFAAQRAYLAALREELQRETTQFAEAMAIPELPVVDRSGALAAASQSVANNLAATADSDDAGLQDLRRALERERAALAAIAPAIKASAARRGAVEEAAKAAAGARAQFLSDASALKTAVTEEEDISEKIAVGWANYYRTLAAAAHQEIVAPVAPAPGAVAPRLEVAPSPEPRPSNGVAPAAIRSTAPGIPPASRYAGDWIYPTVNEHYHGARPESADLIVREERGQMRGSFRVTFRLAPTSTLNPDVQFTFSGPYQNAKSQSFKVTLADGTKGTFEMIPATTSNLLEINFVMDERPGKISRGNFFVLRK